jgi:adenylate cyclase
VSNRQPLILVVDDNEDNRFTLTQRLRREGYTEVVEAEDGHKALRLLAERRFDLVLLDIMMPGIDGYQVLEHIKSDMSLRDIPVIMISAIEDMDSVVRCIRIGAQDYLPKPFNSVLLKARIGACLEQKRLRDQAADHLRQIEQERRRADELLYAMLPVAAVHELKATRMVRPRRFENVVVLFCDVVGFTAYCDQYPPEEAVGHLQTLADAYEEICQRHGLEKIKIVGDAFIATAGLLRHVEEPALASVRCGLEMAATARTLEAGWSVRVGIHLGPVVAGVIGRRHYVFDLWGDTVNTAARLVGQAKPGGVVVSGSIWPHLGERCRGRSCGFVELKGKGGVELIECDEVR